MEDLLNAFFERDLTEVEEKRLDSLLESSPEEAFRFLDMAKTLYLQTGLPNPEKPLSGGPGSASALGGGSKLFLAFLAGSLLTSSAWWASTHLMESKTATTPASIPTALTTLPAPATTGNPAATAERPLTTNKAIPASIPVMVQPQSYVPGKKYGGLSAIVNQASSGIVTVRVLDGRGMEVRLLYAGLLEPGEWAFQWDGRRQDGLRADGGIYQVEIQSGKTILRKEIKIVRERVAS